jgi:glycosyltransferase involved in cell wall biosynthesis
MVADLVDEIKNISGVIEMIASLDNVDSFRLDIVGGGPDEFKLKALTEKHSLLNKIIFFHGQKRNEEVFQYLSACDSLLMNSRHETFSLICAEAMSCGKPVLATRCGGPEEFVTRETGLLISPDNGIELREKFIYMLHHYKEFDPVKIQSYAFEHFSAEKAAESFSTVYEEALMIHNKKY